MQWSHFHRFILEFVVIVLPQLFVMTIFSDYAAMFAALLLCAAVALHIAAVTLYNRPLISVVNGPDHAMWYLLAERNLSFINSFRSAMMVAT
jgi:hypothetical protein